jgi:transporter family protein
MNTLPWWIYALLSAFFAALTTIFAKLGVASVSSNLATAIRTVVILFIAWSIVAITGLLFPSPAIRES